MSIESMETSVKRMQRTVYNAERGLSTSTEALGELKLSYDDLQGMKPEEQLSSKANSC